MVQALFRIDGAATRTRTRRRRVSSFCKCDDESGRPTPRRDLMRACIAAHSTPARALL
jgi:hypothetical protein